MAARAEALPAGLDPHGFPVTPGGDIYILVDNEGARRLTRDAFRQIENGINTGLVRIDQRVITNKAG